MYSKGISTLEKNKTSLKVVVWGSKMKTGGMVIVKWTKCSPKNRLSKGKSWHNLRAK